MVSGGYLAFMPEEKVGVAMGYNMLGMPSQEFVLGLFATLLGKEPEEAIPALKIRKKLKMLAGRYETYRGLSKAEVVYREGRLSFEQDNEYGRTSVLLIPENEKIENYDFYTYSDGIKNPITFDVQSPEKIDLYVGIRFHKIRE